MNRIDEKCAHLNSLRAFTKEELQAIRDDLIRMNVRQEPRPGEIEGVRNAYNNLDYMRQEESTRPYAPGYRHPLTEDSLRILNHTILEQCRWYLPHEKGFYRLGENDKIGDILLPKRDEFVPRIKELIRWYPNARKRYDLITKLAIFHLRFLCDIHPFYDGNGRTARAFMNLELAREGYPMIGLKYNDEDAYEAAFDAYTYDKNITPMKKLILHNIDQELDKQIAIKKR